MESQFQFRSHREFIQRLIMRRRAAKSRAPLSTIAYSCIPDERPASSEPAVAANWDRKEVGKFSGSPSRALENRVGLYLRVEHRNGFSAKALKLVDFSKQLNTGGKDPTRDHRCTDHGGNHIRGT